MRSYLREMSFQRVFVLLIPFRARFVIQRKVLSLFLKSRFGKILPSLAGDGGERGRCELGEL